MPLDTMIDLETMSVTPDAVILQIAAVKFDPFDDYLEQGITVQDLPFLNVLVDVDSQTDRNINESTMQWWVQQDAQVQDRVFATQGRVSFAEAMQQTHRFIWNSGRIWSQGLSFDISILEHAYRSLDQPYPWAYWQTRDSRTLLDLVAVNLPPATHDAVEDCFRQIVGVQKALAALGVTRFIR